MLLPDWLTDISLRKQPAAELWPLSLLPRHCCSVAGDCTFFQWQIKTRLSQYIGAKHRPAGGISSARPDRDMACPLHKTLSLLSIVS